MAETHPLVSVVMGVYNAERTLEKAVRSILEQTYPHFEFIIVDDGSTDSSPEILRRLQAEDARIRVITQDTNAGLTRALNTGIADARGALVARQDADDLSVPHRFEQQVARFEHEDDLLLLGSNAVDVYPGKIEREWGFHGDPSIRIRAMLCAPFPHASAMMRADALAELGGYDEEWDTAQDMELWMRFARKGRISMIPEPLIRRRIHPDSISGRKKFQQFRDALRARLKHAPHLGAKLYAVFFSLRSLVIALLPHSAMQAMAKFRSRT